MKKIIVLLLTLAGLTACAGGHKSVKTGSTDSKVDKNSDTLILEHNQILSPQINEHYSHTSHAAHASHASHYSSK